MNKYVKIVSAICLTAIMAAIIVSCNKEKTNSQVANEKTPIAQFNRQTNQIESLISCNKIQEAINANIKGEDQYVVESWSVVDEENAEPYLNIVILDVENESSMSTSIFKSVVYKENDDYYLEDNFRQKHYSFTQKSMDGDVYIISVNGNDISVDLWDGVSVQPPTHTCTCTGECSTGCKVNTENGDCSCTKCNPSYLTCTKTESVTYVTVSFLNSL